MNPPPAAPTKEVPAIKSHPYPIILIVTFAILLFSQAPVLGSGNRVETTDDALITSLVKESLLFHLLLNSRTQTSGGVVTLSGNADNIAEKELGSDLAAEVNGVKSVINNMVIGISVSKN